MKNSTKCMHAEDIAHDSTLCEELEHARAMTMMYTDARTRTSGSENRLIIFEMTEPIGINPQL